MTSFSASMVITRRQKERSESKDFSNAEHDDAEELTTTSESNKAIPTLPEENIPSDHSSVHDPKTALSEEKKYIDGSDLFVLDKTGDGEGNGIDAPSDADDKEPSSGYGISSCKRKKKNRQKKKPAVGNALSSLIPGYTAAMQLNTSSLDKYRPAGGIKALQRRAERSDASTKAFVREATSKHAEIMKTRVSELSTSKYATSYSSFKKGKKRAPPQTAGAGWFNMKPTPMSEELKADIAVIRNRNYLDPKKFYKSADKFSSVVQVGTVIEGAAEYYSSRLTKKQRRGNLADEIMADPASADYARKKFRSMAQEKTRESQQRSNVHRPKRGKRGF